MLYRLHKKTSIWGKTFLCFKTPRMQYGYPQEVQKDLQLLLMRIVDHKSIRAKRLLQLLNAGTNTNESRATSWSVGPSSADSENVKDPRKLGVDTFMSTL
jgi:hypothetical protein